MGNLCSVTLSVDQLVSGCIKSTARHATYMFKPARNLESLRTAMEDLKAMKVDVIRKVEAAERQKMKRLKQVELWLSRVERVENEVDDLINIILLPRKCIWGSCPNCYSNHKLATRIVKCLTEVDGLKTKGQFDEVAEHLHSQVDELPAEPTVGAESKFAHIWKSITEDKIGIVGIYGMGGVGKTTPLKQVNNKFANTSHEFDHVIWVTVSKDFNAEKVQQEIWKKIGRRFGPEKSFEEKAVDIYRILKNEKFVLLLDDIWERIDLAQLGVPLPSRKSEANHVLFTTRSKEVCGLMEAHDKIEVGCLSPEKAWELFSEKVGEQTLNLHPDIPRLGKIVAQECGGLPLALITIARVMASSSTPEEWSRTANVLRNSASRFSAMGEDFLY